MCGLLLDGAAMLFLLPSVCQMLQLLFRSPELVYGQIYGQLPLRQGLLQSRIGGRVRGPLPLIHQWIDFCLQAARALPFVQEVIPGASPFALLESSPMQNSQDLTKDKPKLDTNLIAGVPPPDILAKCEFLEPLSDAALMDYQWLISSMRKPGRGFINNMQDYISSMVQNFRLKPQSR